MLEFAEMPEANRELFKANSRALRNYKPGVYSRKIMLVKTTPGQRYAPYRRNPKMVWGKLALCSVEMIMIKGNHDELVRNDSQMNHLAKAFQTCLDRVERAA